MPTKFSSGSPTTLATTVNIIHAQCSSAATTVSVFDLRDAIRNSTPSADMANIDWDPYGSTSSFYGPGAVLCWVLVTLSYLIKRAETQSWPRRWLLTNDFVGMIAYPLIAAGDTLVRATALPPAERPRLVATMTTARLNATIGPADVAADMDTLRACVGLAASLRVCELCLLPGFWILSDILSGQQWERERGQSSSWSSFLLYR